MAERIIPTRTYVIVCVVLVLLTVLTTAVSFLDMRGFWHIVCGVTIGLCKATLVVLFFMHALFSSRVVWIVIVVSCFWLGILFVLSLNDYFTRDLIPFTPGH